jgi:3-oxoacyl-[acyl-carrier-protein] synthase-3
MTALDAVATYLPDERIRIEDLAGQLGLTAMQVKVFRRYHGLAEVRWDRGGSLLDLLLAAAARLDALRGREHLCARLGIGHSVAFTVSHQSCATGLLAIDLAGRLLDAEPDPEALVLVLAGEKAFTLESRLLPETSIFGEGSSACLVRRTGPRDRLLAYAAAMRGEFDSDDPEAALRFQREYPESLAGTIRAAVAAAGLELADLALILPHNVNVVSWQRLCKRLGVPVARVLLDTIPSTGHVFCADAFLNYRHAVANGRLRPGDRYLMAAAGAGRGATFSAMVFEH